MNREAWAEAIRTGQELSQRDPGGARTIVEPVLAEIEASCGADSLELVEPLRILAYAASALGQADSVELAWRRVSILRSHAGVHPNQIAKALYVVGSLAHSGGRSAEGEAPLREALLLGESMSPAPRKTITIHRLGQILAAVGRASEALPYLRQAYEEHRDSGELGLSSYAAISYASCLATLGRSEEGIGILGEVRERIGARSPGARALAFIDEATDQLRRGETPTNA